MIVIQRYANVVAVPDVGLRRPKVVALLGPVLTSRKNESQAMVTVPRLPVPIDFVVSRSIVPNRDVSRAVSEHNRRPIVVLPGKTFRR